MLSLRILTGVSLLALFLAISSTVSADALQPWESWVLEKHPQHRCPWTMDKKPRRACIWPGQLALTVEDKAARFSYALESFGKNNYVALPGDARQWPTAVTVNGAAAAVIERNKRPYVSVPEGSYTITGLFRWQKRPARIAMPDEIAIISLTINGKPQTIDRRKGQLLFANSAAKSPRKSNDSVKIAVFRLLKDDIPLRMITELTLTVSGKARELRFGQVMLEDTEVLNIQSPIPARIEVDGSMRAQVTPGEHRLRIFSRFTNSPTNISTKKLSDSWPETEYISFQSAPAIRQVKISGPVSVDTSQLSMPFEWAEYPTWMIKAGQSLSINTELRGDHAPAANTLNIERQLWLDFNGQGITTLDRINGTMNQGWRLNAAAENQIGRATVDGKPVLITRDKESEGIEIRSPDIELEAVTRLADRSDFSASGWAARANQLRSTLHLPPGWRVLHASGVDQVSGTWLSQWDLWDVFLALIIVSATRRLFNLGTAALAGITFIVVLHEPGSPLLWVAPLLVFIAFMPIASDKIKKLLSTTGSLLAAGLVLAIISFAIEAFRLAIYPALERAQLGNYQQGQYKFASKMPDLARAVPVLSDADQRLAGSKTALEEIIVTAQKRDENLYELSEDDRVQTGPGMPTWAWNAIRLNASGTVSAEQRLQLVYSPPWLTALWRVASVVLLALYSGLLIIRFLRLVPFTALASTPATANGFALLAILLVTASHSPGGLANAAQGETYPPKYLLDDLAQRLTKAPECLPGCASLNQGMIDISDTTLSITFSAYADADIALPLPHGFDSWATESLTAQQQPVPLQRHKQQLFAYLAKGHHQLTLRGRIINRDQLSIHFPLALHNIQLNAPGWITEGLIDGRARNNTLSLRPRNKSAGQQLDTLKADPAPAIVIVKRQFLFGKRWQLFTTVERISPLQGTIALPVQLVDGERPLKDMGAVTNGAIMVQLGHRQKQVSWPSDLSPVAQFTLTAGDGKDYIEQWSFTPSSLWHLEYQGIPPIKPEPDAAAFAALFKPWPNESLQLAVDKPAGIAGPTYTVETAELSVTAGSALQRSSLSLQIRSSLGSEYPLSLPANSEVLQLRIDGNDINTPADHNISIPLQPGSQQIDIEFQNRDELGIITSSPVIDLPNGAANIRLEFALPRDRWPLFLSGPAIGPAMLYWGVLCVIVLVALMLPILARRLQLEIPVSTVGWLLLGLGLSTVNSYGVLVIALMFFLLAARKRFVNPDSLSRTRFNGLQFFIVVWIAVAVLMMLAAIPMGLLSTPDMKVIGNGSSSHFYAWYRDTIKPNEDFPTAQIISMPILAYRAVMLLWSLWLSTQLIRWASWAWQCWTSGASWMPVPTKPQEKYGRDDG